MLFWSLLSFALFNLSILINLCLDQFGIQKHKDLTRNVSTNSHAASKKKVSLIITFIEYPTNNNTG